MRRLRRWLWTLKHGLSADRKYEGGGFWVVFVEKIARGVRGHPELKGVLNFIVFAYLRNIANVAR